MSATCEPPNKRLERTAEKRGRSAAGRYPDSPEQTIL
jgi:hypothetical protein